MASETRTDGSVIWIGGTLVSCKVSDVLGVMTSQHLGDEALLRFAAVTKLQNLPRSKEYLANFLSGKAETKRFPLSDLLKDDGVRQIFVRHFARPMSFEKNVVTVGQQAYRDQDWKNSLGTYFIYYIDIGRRKNMFGMETEHVLAWGEDTYQWAPDDARRFTQCLHKAASRLEKVSDGRFPRAAPFKMLASDIIVDTSTGLCSPVMSLPAPSLTIRRTQIRRKPARPMCRGE